MLRQHLVVGVRGLWHDRTSTAINVLGLACAMACAIRVCAFVAEEFRYVDYHANGHRIYRILREVRHESRTNYSDWVAGGTTVAALAAFPQIEAGARSSGSHLTRRWLRAGERTVSDFFCRADPELLDVFGFEIVRGELSADAMTVVVTESLARKLFGDEDPIGRTVTLVDAGPMGDYTVTGILQDITPYAYIRIGALTIAPPSDHVSARLDWWEGWRSDLGGPKNYLLLPEGFDPEPVERALNEALARNVPEDTAARSTLHLQPMADARLGYGSGRGTIQAIRFYTMIALIIAAVACANAVNLAAARTVARAGEIATRKAVGARWPQIVSQFLAEGLVVAALAAIFGLGLAQVELVRQIFGDLPLRPHLTDPRFLAGVAGAGLLVAAGATLYPGVVAARLPMSELGRQSARVAGRGSRVRNALIVAQLGCAVVFIAGTIVVRGQTAYMRAADPGFDRDQLLTTRYVLNDTVLWNRRHAIKDAFLRIPGVEGATTLWPGPGMERNLHEVVPADDPQRGVEAQLLGIDADFLDTYGVELLAGRNLRAAEAPDEAIVNETAARRFGWIDSGPQDAVGRQLLVLDERRTVVGVVHDFHYRSFREAIPPMVLRDRPQIALAIRVRLEGLESTMAAVDETWQRFFEQPNQLRFVGQMWGFSTGAEQHRSEAFALMSWTAVLLAALGVYGMAAYEAQQRRREIAVRKALGATPASIVRLFWRDHALLVLLAVGVGVPVAYRLNTSWLEGFAYRTEPSSLAYAGAAAAVGALFFAVIGAQAARLSRIHPAETLRSQ